MKYHFKIMSFIGIIMCLFSCKEVSSEKEKESSALSVTKATKIDSVCQALLSKGNTVGFSIAIAHEGNILFSKGYGLANIDSRKPATENTIYAIASISKFITAVTTMKLLEDGKIDLADKVVDYLLDFPRQEGMEDITIEHLLRHQSGLVDHEDWFDSLYIEEGRVFERHEFFDFIDRPLFFEPGSSYSYSNSGYATLSIILEQISNQSFQDLIIEKIGKPLELNSLGQWPLNWNKENASMSYELTENGVDTSFHMMTKSMKGDGGLSASAADLVRLASSLAYGEYLKEASLDKIMSPTKIGEVEIDYGLGVKMGTLSDQETWGHSGGYKGTGWAIVSHYPESGFTFAAVINTNYSPEEAWTIRHLIMPIVLGIDRPVYQKQTIENPEKYIGKYTAINRWGKQQPSVRTISFENGELVRDDPHTEHPGSTLYPIGENQFSWNPYPFDEFKFHVVNGEVVAVSEYMDGFFAMVRLKE
ncbi:serine hydrolase domain-containing protein [Ekhidna sp.]